MLPKDVYEQFHELFSISIKNKNEKTTFNNTGNFVNESKVNPVPNADDWFHAKIVVNGKKISVFVNHSEKPSLVVDKLTNVSKGKAGLWLDSEGSFANLEITTVH